LIIETASNAGSKVILYGGVANQRLAEQARRSAESTAVCVRKAMLRSENGEQMQKASGSRFLRPERWRHRVRFDSARLSPASENIKGGMP